MDSLIERCYVCGEKETQSHHLIPVGYGGKDDGPQIPLCGSCHQKCHTAALIIMAKNKNLARLHTLFSNEAQQARATKVVRLIVLAKLTKDERKDAITHRLTLVFDHATMGKLRYLKAMSGLSMQKYLNALINQEAARQFIIDDSKAKSKTGY